MSNIQVPGIPHHVTQRGVRRMQTFFEDADYEMYLSLLAEWCKKRGVELWVRDWPGFLASDERSAYDNFRKHERTGRPLGDESFIDRVSRLTGRELAMKKPGRKKRDGK